MLYIRQTLPIVLLLFVLIPPSLFAQQFIERTYCNYYQATSEQLISGNEDTLYLSIGGRCSYGVLKVDQFGHLFNSYIPEDGSGVVMGRYHLNRSPDSTILMGATKKPGTDYGKPRYYVSKYKDTTLWYSIIDPSSQTESDFYSLTGLDDSSIVLSTSDGLYKLNEQGDSLWNRKPTSFNNTHHLCPTYGSRFLASSGDRIYHLDQDGYKLDSLQLTDTIRDMKRMNINHFVIASEHKLLAIDSTLSVKQQTSYYQGSQPMVAQSIAINDSLIGVISDGLSGIYYHLYDRSLSFLREQYESDYLSGGDILLTEENIYVATIDKNTSKHYRPLLKSFSLAGVDSNYHHDIGVTDVRFSNKRISDGQNLPNPTQYYNVTYTCSVTVNNFGNDTIQTLWLNADEPYGVNCALGHSSNEYDSLSFSPGDTLNLLFGDVTFQNLTNTSKILNFCVNTTGPDNQLDADKANDSSCINHYYTGIRETSLPKSFRVYPNPFDQNFRIDLPQTFKGQHSALSLRLFDLQGRKVHEQKIRPKRGLYIDQLEDLPKGVLLLQLFDGEKSYTKKIVHH